MKFRTLRFNAALSQLKRRHPDVYRRLARLKWTPSAEANPFNTNGSEVTFNEAAKDGEIPLNVDVICTGFRFIDYASTQIAKRPMHAPTGDVITSLSANIAFALRTSDTPLVVRAMWRRHLARFDTANLTQLPLERHLRREQGFSSSTTEAVCLDDHLDVAC